MTDCFQKRLAFNVANGTADLRDDEVEGLLGGVELDPAFDFIGDVRNHLDGFSKIIAAPLALDDALVDASRGHTVVAGGLDAGETLIVAEIEVGFLAIGGHVALAVLVGVERARVDVDVRIEFLDGDFVAPCLEQFSKGGGDDALAQRGGHTAGDEDVSGSHILEKAQR